MVAESSHSPSTSASMDEIDKGQGVSDKMR